MSTVLSADISTIVLCSYKNQTSRVQVVRIADVSGQNIEKVILPSETFLFEAPVKTNLGIYIERAGRTTLLDSIPCSNLQTQIPLNQDS